MSNRALPVMALLVGLAPATVLAQGVQIDHKAVGCIVAGKFPKMNACFTPAASVGRARVYFRPEGAPSWYYVDMKSDAPCHAGVLPKPSKKLINKKVEYYVEVADRSFNAGRTSEYGPTVVGSESECRKDLPIAPISATGPAAVFPAVPVGFASTGAVSATTVVLGVAAAGAAATGVVVATSGDDTTTTTIATGGGGGTTLATTTTTTSTTTTTLVSGNKPPFAVLRTTPDPPKGPSPLTVRFDLCGSSDPDGNPLTFFFDFGDGVQMFGGCAEFHTYTAPVPFKAGAATMSWEFLGSVRDGSLSAQRTRTVTAETAPPPTTTPVCGRLAPTVSLTNPPPPIDCTISSTIAATATASAASPRTITKVRFELKSSTEPPGSFPPICTGSGSFTVVNTVDDFSAPYSASLVTTAGGGCHRVEATAVDDCGNPSPPDSHDFEIAGYCFYPLLPPRGLAQLHWASTVSAEGSRLQVVVNGADLSYPRTGRAYVQNTVRPGENRLEATVVAGDRSGEWRLEFLDDLIVAGSLRVVVGDVVSISDRVVTFRLTGRQGQRIVVTFETK